MQNLSSNSFKPVPGFKRLSLSFQLKQGISSNCQQSESDLDEDIRSEEFLAVDHEELEENLGSGFQEDDQVEGRTGTPEVNDRCDQEDQCNTDEYRSVQEYDEYDDEDDEIQVESGEYSQQENIVTGERILQLFPIHTFCSSKNPFKLISGDNNQ